jgi:excisionase family DNA binding protein
MTTKDAAEYLGVSLQTIHRRIQARELLPVDERNPALKRPRKILLNRADVEALKYRAAEEKPGDDLSG